MKKLSGYFVNLVLIGVLVSAIAAVGAQPEDPVTLASLEKDPNVTTQKILDIKGDNPKMVDVQNLLVYKKKDSGDLLAIRYDVPARGKAGVNGKFFVLSVLDSPDGAVLDKTMGKVTFRLSAGLLVNPEETSKGPVIDANPKVVLGSAHIRPDKGGPLVLSYLYEATLNIINGDNQYRHLQLNIFKDEKGEWRLSTDTGASPNPADDFSHMFCWQKSLGIESSIPIPAFTSWDDYLATNHSGSN